MNEILTEKQPIFQNDALDEFARGREEYVRLVKLLEDAEAMVKDVQDFQCSKEIEEGYFREADAWLKDERGLGTPHMSTEDFNYRGHFIPKNTVVILNTVSQNCSDSRVHY